MLHKRLSAKRVKVKCLKEVGHTQLVILKGTLVGHLKSNLDAHANIEKLKIQWNLKSRLVQYTASV